MGTIRFDIRHPNGHRESAVIEGERALIGSAAHCDVRLPMDQAAYEHVVVEVIAGTLRAEARAEEPPATIDDMPLTVRALAPDSVLGVGRIRLFVSYVFEGTEGAEFVTSTKKERGTLAQLGVVAILGLAAYLLLVETSLSISPPPAQALELFAKAEVKCPQKAEAQAIAFAEEQLTAAHGKRERMPFSAADGVSAVGTYETAAACFRAGGLEEEAEDAEHAAKSLARDLTDDLRARQLRLSHMLKVEDFELALRDIKVLQALTRGKKGPYVEWLARTRKQLNGKVKVKKR